MSRNSKQLRRSASAEEVDAFLERVSATPCPKTQGRRGRLIFALDATASREPTWDRASHLQAAMFSATTDLGGLDIQLCHYRGFEEFYASRWLSDSDTLLKQMTRVRCAAGLTQIRRVLQHALDENRKQKVDALVFIGDCLEESRDRLAGIAGNLGLNALPAFVFQEGRDPEVERCFRDIARLSGGAYCHFDDASPQRLRDLLGAVAVYAAGGRAALQGYVEGRDPAVALLTRQVLEGR